MHNFEQTSATYHSAPDLGLWKPWAVRKCGSAFLGGFGTPWKIFKICVSEMAFPALWQHYSARSKFGSCVFNGTFYRFFKKDFVQIGIFRANRRRKKKTYKYNAFSFSRFTWLFLVLEYYYRYKLGISWWKTGSYISLILIKNVLSDLFMYWVRHMSPTPFEYSG